MFAYLFCYALHFDKGQKTKKLTLIIQLFVDLLKAYDFFNCLKKIKLYFLCLKIYAP